jgi:hypothetical protein
MLPTLSSIAGDAKTDRVKDEDRHDSKNQDLDRGRQPGAANGHGGDDKAYFRFPLGQVPRPI